MCSMIMRYAVCCRRYQSEYPTGYVTGMRGAHTPLISDALATDTPRVETAVRRMIRLWCELDNQTCVCEANSTIYG